MSVTVVIGTQWGDEGKGKVVNALAKKANVVARYQGGPNAGHTVITNGVTHKFHLLPSGITQQDVVNLITDEVKVDPLVLADELNRINYPLFDPLRGGLKISRKAQLILPYHTVQDGYSEERRSGQFGEQAIGTTLRGMGPAQADHRFRNGLNAGDMLAPDFRDKVRRIAELKNLLFQGYYGRDAMDPDEVWVKIEPTIDVLAGLVDDTTQYMRYAISTNQNVLMEGAQGVLLDLNYGTYPFVTSSNPGVGGALNGTGVSWRDVTRVIGVAKMYMTRVGGGPFPTRVEPDMEAYLQERGGEVGTTTGRKRNCGWLDLVLLKYACELNGVTELAITKGDVLDEMHGIPMALGHELYGEVLSWPNIQRLEEVHPVYDHIVALGWKTSTRGLIAATDLPEAYRYCLAVIEAHSRTSVGLVSTGPDDTEMIILRPHKPGECLSKAFCAE
jgi:adenylosuccinate synthase